MQMDSYKPYILWALAAYVTYELSSKLLRNCDLALRTISQQISHENLEQLQEFRSLLDEERIIPENVMKISIVCTVNDKIGEHAFLFFERKRNGHVVYHRADYRPRNIAPDAGRLEVFSQISVGEPAISVDFDTDIETAAKWLESMRFVTFDYQYRSEEEVSDKISALSSTSSKYTYSFLGDHSSTSVNSKSNNQNCATWCAKVLEDFGHNIDIDKTYFAVARSPRFVVELAKKKQATADGKTKKIATPAKVFVTTSTLIAIIGIWKHLDMSRIKSI